MLFFQPFTSLRFFMVKFQPHRGVVWACDRGLVINQYLHTDSSKWPFKYWERKIWNTAACCSLLLQCNSNINHFTLKCIHPLLSHSHFTFCSFASSFSGIQRRLTSCFFFCLLHFGKGALFLCSGIHIPIRRVPDQWGILAFLLLILPSLYCFYSPR